MATEEPSYTILNQTEDFDLRRYEPQIVAQTWMRNQNLNIIGTPELAHYNPP